MTEEHLAVRREWEQQRAREATLVTEGLLSADEADASRLAGLLERRDVGELAEAEFQRARAEVHARRVTRREAAHAAGLLGEGELREARLDLAEALAEVTGDARRYAVAWNEHLAWRRESTRLLVEAGRMGEGAARDRVEAFLLRNAWPPGTAAHAERELAPFLSSRWGWVDEVEVGPADVRRVRIRFGGPTGLQIGQERDLWRGGVLAGRARIEDLERDGAVVVAEVVSHPQGCVPRAGDIATSD